MSDFFYIRFLSDSDSINWLQVNIKNFEDYKNYIISITDEDESIYYANSIENFWYNYNIGGFFKYDIKLLNFNGETIDIIGKEYFNFDNHNFNIILRSEDENEIKIWKYYLWLLQLKYNIRFNILDNIFPEQNEGDYIEISRKAYDNYLRKSEPLTDDYSSITIIRILFGVVEDDSEILNHPWLKNNFI